MATDLFVCRAAYVKRLQVLCQGLERSIQRLSCFGQKLTGPLSLQCCTTRKLIDTAFEPVEEEGDEGEGGGAGSRGAIHDGAACIKERQIRGESGCQLK